MAFIPPIILLLTALPAYFFTRRRRHILLVILVALSLVFVGSFTGLALAYFIDGGENDQRILRAFINGFWFSVFGVVGGIYWGKKTRYKATPEQLAHVGEYPHGANESRIAETAKRVLTRQKRQSEKSAPSDKL